MKKENTLTKSLTKELSENAGEEAQVARDIVSHGRRKRLHQSVYTEHSLQELRNKRINQIFTSNLNAILNNTKRGIFLKRET